MTSQGEQTTNGMVGADQAVEPEADQVRRGPSGVLAAGSVLTALFATSCCVLPFALFTAGISGAWMGQLRALEPYQPYFLGLALACIGGGFYAVYRRPKTVDDCEDGYCARPASRLVVKSALWLSSAVVVLVMAWPKVLPLLVGEQPIIN